MVYVVGYVDVCAYTDVCTCAYELMEARAGSVGLPLLLLAW